MKKIDSMKKSKKGDDACILLNGAIPSSFIFFPSILFRLSFRNIIQWVLIITNIQDTHWWGGRLTPLQRCSRCILPTKLIGQYIACMRQQQALAKQNRIYVFSSERSHLYSKWWSFEINWEVHVTQFYMINIISYNLCPRFTLIWRDSSC